MKPTPVDIPAFSDSHPTDFGDGLEHLSFQPDGIGKHMVILQNRDAVLDRPLDFTVRVLCQHFLHISNGSGGTFFVDFFAQ